MHALNTPELMIPNAYTEFDADGNLTNAGLKARIAKSSPHLLRLHKRSKKTGKTCRFFPVAMRLHTRKV